MEPNRSARAAPSSSPPVTTFATPDRRVQRRRLHVGRPAGRHGAAPRREGASATIVLTPVENPLGIWPGRDRRGGQHPGLSREARPRSRFAATRSTLASTCSNPIRSDRIPRGINYSIERGYFPSLVQDRSTFVAYIYRGYWIDIGTPREVRAGAPRHHGRPFRGAAVRRARGQGCRVAAAPRSPLSATLVGPCFIDDDAVVEAGATIGRVLGRRPRAATSAPAPRVEGVDSLAWHARRRACELVTGAVAGRQCTLGERTSSWATARCSAIDAIPDRLLTHDRRGLTSDPNREDSSVNVPASIFKAYDVRALYPSELERGGRARHWPRLRRVSRAPRRSPCRETCACRRRRSRPPSSTAPSNRAPTSWTSACAPPTCSTSASSARASKAARRSRLRTTRANTTASRWCGARPFRCRAMRASATFATWSLATGFRSPTRPRGRHTHVSLLDDYVDKVMGFIDATVIKPFNVVLDAGSGMAGLVAPQPLRTAPLQDDTPVLRDRRPLSESRSQPAHRREPRRHRRAGHRREGRHRHRLGRRRRPLLLHRRQRRVHRRRLHHGPAGRSGAASSRRARR